MRKLTWILLVLLWVCSCSRTGQFYVTHRTIETSKFICYRGQSSLTPDEALAYCDTAKECEDVCDKARNEKR